MTAKMREVHNYMKARSDFYSAYQTTKGLHFMTNCIAFPHLWLVGGSKNGNNNH